MSPKAESKIKPKIEHNKWKPMYLMEEDESHSRARFLMSRGNLEESRRAIRIRKAIWILLLALLFGGAMAITLLTLLKE